MRQNPPSSSLASDFTQYQDFRIRRATAVTAVDVMRLKQPPMMMSIGTKIPGQLVIRRKVGTM